MITFSHMEQIKWGIVGPGKIAAHFAHDLNLVDQATISAVASRNKKRAQDFGNDFGVEHVFDSYEELFRSDVVDVIYIATPHVFHKSLAISAMEHGKHVLCEKPMGVNLAEVKEMITTAKANNVFLMEALWSRFHPSILQVKNKVDKGVLGSLRYINADFAFYGMDKGAESRLLNPELAGGSLLDIGIYPVFLSYLLFGMPNNISAKAKILENGLETQVSMIMDYEEGQALLYSSLEHSSRMSAEIAGELGNIYLDPRWHETNGFTLELNGDLKRYDLPKWGKGYTHEIEEVHKCLEKGVLESELWSHQNSLDLITLLDQVRSLTGIHFPFEKV